MAISPKAKTLLNKVTSLTEEGRNNLLGLLSILEEIGEPMDDISNTVGEPYQYDLVIERRRRREKIKTALGFIGFLILYILANSIAPTVWTPDGTAPIF